MRNTKIKNKKMNPETYALKTQVVNLIREAKRGGARLPWIRVIIGDQTSNHKDVLGCAVIKGDKMWITEEAINLGTDTLRNIVFHEIVHAVTGFGHDDRCPLMKPTLDGYLLNKTECMKYLKGYIKHGATMLTMAVAS